MARQPIFDRRSRVVGYELLYRGENPGNGPLDEATSARAVLNAVAEVGLQRLCGSHPAYVNISQELLFNPAVRLLPSHRVVLELLEDTRPTSRTMEAVRSLKCEGYTIALDDFVFEPHQIPLLALADIVKVDIMALTWPAIVRGMPRLKETGARLLAEKVEGPVEFNRCKTLGFHMFQGFFFERPEILETKTLTPSRVALLAVLAEVHRPDARAADIETAVAADPGLAVRLLRLVNSAAMALPRRVSSVRTAVAMLGARRIQALAILLAAQARSDSPPYLATVALLRARMCEEFARRFLKDDPSVHFTVGLLSVMDAMLELPMQTVVDNIPLAPEVAEALVHPMGENTAATALRLVLLNERGDWDEMGALGYDPKELAQLFTDCTATGYEMDAAA